MLHVACWTLVLIACILIGCIFYLRRLLTQLMATVQYGEHAAQFAQFLATLDAKDDATFFQSILNEATQPLGANGGCLYTYDRTQLNAVAVIGDYPTYFASSHIIAVETLLAKNAHVMNEIVMPAGVPLESVVRSALLTPLRFGQELLGCIVYVNPTRTLFFQQHDLVAAQARADTIATRLHQQKAAHAHLQQQHLDTALTLAQHVQQLVLPRPNAWPQNLEHTILYKNAQQIGGDFYFCKQLDEHNIALAIADVAGKGIPAALMMASVYTHLRHCAQTVRTPTQVLCTLNVLLSEELHENNFTTMTYAVLNRATRTLRFARAGHTPLIIVHNGEPHSHSPNGTALGLYAQQDFNAHLQERELQLQAGDGIVLFTDGLTEAVNSKGEFFGLSRLLGCLNQDNASAETLQQAIADEVARHTENIRDQDDLTLLILKI